MKYFFLIITTLLLFQKNQAQDPQPRPRYTPFTAVKWQEDNPHVRVNDEWYLLLMVDGTETKAIVDFCKKKYEDKWQKRFSEDFNIALEAMGKPVKEEIKLKLSKDGKVVEKTLPMTSDNRKMVLKYNRENASGENNQTQQQIVENVQKDIAPKVNIKDEKIYPFKSAKFEFTYTGNKMYSGTETVYIDDYGKTVIVISEKPNGMFPESITYIWKANQCTTLNHIKKTYYTTPVRPKATEPPTISYSTEEQRKQGGYTKKPDETVLGKQCEVYEHSKMNVTYWLWKNFEFKLVNYSLGGNMGYTKEPKSVEENIILPGSLFAIPVDYKKQ